MFPFSSSCFYSYFLFLHALSIQHRLCESFKENGGPWWQTEAYCALFGSCCSSVFNNEWEHYSKNYFTNIYSLIQVKESRQVVGKQKKTEFFCWKVCFNTICTIQYFNILEERVCATHCFWDVKSKVHEDCRKIDQLIQVIKHSEYYLWSCFPSMCFPRGSVLSETVRAEFHSAVAAAPKRQPERLGVTGNPWLHVQGAWDAMCLHQIDGIRERSYFYP